MLSSELPSRRHAHDTDRTPYIAGVAAAYAGKFGGKQSQGTSFGKGNMPSGKSATTMFDVLHRLSLSALLQAATHFLGPTITGKRRLELLQVPLKLAQEKYCTTPLVPIRSRSNLTTLPTSKASMTSQSLTLRGTLFSIPFLSCPTVPSTRSIRTMEPSWDSIILESPALLFRA